MRWFGGPAAMAVARPRALLGARDEGREVDRLAWPIIADGVFQTALDLTNLALIGRVGTEALSGVGAATQLIQLGVAALAAVSVGGMVLVAQASGAGDARAAGRSGWRSASPRRCSPPRSCAPSARRRRSPRRGRSTCGSPRSPSRRWG